MARVFWLRLCNAEGRRRWIRHRIESGPDPSRGRRRGGARIRDCARKQEGGWRRGRGREAGSWPDFLPPGGVVEHLAPAGIGVGLEEGVKDGALAAVGHLGGAAADEEDGTEGHQLGEAGRLLADEVLDVDLVLLVAREGGEEKQIGIERVPLLVEEEVGLSVAAAKEEKGGAGRAVRLALLDEAADGGDAGAGGHGDEGTASIGGAVDGREDGLVVEGEAGAGAEASQVAGAEPPARLAQNGPILDEGHQQLQAGRVRAGSEDEAGTAVGDAEVAAADEGKDVQKAVRGDANRGEVLEKLENGAAGAGGVVEIVVEEFGRGELEEPLPLSLIRGKVGDAAEKGAARHGCHVDSFEEQLAQGAG